MVICLERGADSLYMVQLMPLHPKTPSSIASFDSRLVLPFWYRLSQVVLEKKPLNGCSSSYESVSLIPKIKSINLLANIQEQQWHQAYTAMLTLHQENVNQLTVPWAHVSSHPKQHVTTKRHTHTHGSNRPHICTPCIRCGLKGIHNHISLS